MAEWFEMTMPLGMAYTCDRRHWVGVKRQRMLYMVDISLPMVEAWRAEFSGVEGVEIHHADLLEVASDTIVSPANSYGDMGGGIDLAYRAAFGWGLQRHLQDEIAKRPQGYLPVGEALVLRLEAEPIQHLIVAPTMHLPGPAKAADVRLATLAMLRAWEESKSEITHVFCPGFGTGIGKLPVGEAAATMAKAYQEFRRGDA